jgi:hypothetical protein
LITGLGKLAAGADVASLGLSAGAGLAGGDVEMVDAPVEEGVAVPAAAVSAGQGGKSQGQGQAGKGKKKGGKGKR